MAGKKKPALGNGLEGMFGVDETATEEKEKDVSRETFLRLSEIEPNRTQPRRNFNEDALQELADSIKQYGIIQPLVVQKKGKRYEIIAGERRWRAARKAGLLEAPVIIKEFAPEDVFAIALIENIQREDLNPIEEAQAYSRLIQEYHLKQDELAEKVAKNRVTITNSMRLLKLDERVQQMLIDNMLTGGHARALLGVSDKEQQHVLAMRVFDEKLSVRETENLVKRILTEKEKPQEPKTEKETQDDSVIYRDIENRMKDILGTKVEIKKKTKNKGKIEIEYYSLEELERIIDMMNRLK
ncbi:MAG: ParB/RepB/Spo0J family partition protein [Lachnospiraceae bacterium]|nr:ParB/RepB/Spo0J family partition protein [Lachnospiraceae bacterium]